MAASFMMVGLAEMLLLMGGGGLLATPPGERDAKFLQVAPADSVVYMEWSSRGKGKPGGKGVDGFVTDPEIVEFATKLKSSLIEMLMKQSERGPAQAKAVMKVAPELALLLIDRPGCVYATFDPEAAQKAAKEAGPKMGPGALGFGLRGTMIINGGDKADEIAALILKLTNMLPAELIKKDLKEQVFPIPLPVQDLKVTLHREGNYFIVHFGDKPVTEIAKRLTNPPAAEKTLAGNKRFTKAVDPISMDRLSTVTWVDLQSAVHLASKAMGPQGAMINGMAQLLGLGGVESYATTTGVIDGQLVQKAILKTDGKREGVLAITAGRSITADDLKHVPGDADMVAALSLNLQKVLATARQIVGQADPQSLEVLERDLAEIEEGIGMKLDDLFAIFGEVFVVHNSPSSGGVLMTSPVLTLEVKDAQKGYAAFSQLMKLLKNVLPGEQGERGPFSRGVFLANHKFMDRSIYFVNSVGGGVPIAPAFCITDKHLMIGLTPQALKAHMRAQEDKAESFAVTFGKTKKWPEGDLMFFSYIDAETPARLVYSFLPYFSSAMFSQMQSVGMPMDTFSFPSARAVLPYMQDAVSSVKRTDQGIVWDVRSAFPIRGAANAAFMLPSMLFTFGARNYEEFEFEELEIEEDGKLQLEVKPRAGNKVRVQVVPERVIEVKEATP